MHKKIFNLFREWRCWWECRHNYAPERLPSYTLFIQVCNHCGRVKGGNPLKWWLHNERGKRIN
jgi:hypothetical protein